MKRILTIATGLVLSAVSAATAANLPVWQGEMFFTQVPAACDSLDFVVGDYTRVVYAPHLASTSPPEGLALFFPRSALIMVGTGGTLRGNAAFTATWIGSHGTTNKYTNTVNLTMKPATIGANTPEVDMTGVLNEVFGVAGCNVTVNASLLLRPQ